jgi:hypothetical protein
VNERADEEFPTGPLDDEKVANLPPAKPTSTAEAKAFLAGVPDVAPIERVPTATDDGVAPDPDGTTRFLQWMLSRSFFLNYFSRVADRKYVGKRPEVKFRQLVDERRWFFRVALVSDLVLMWAWASVLIFLVVGVVYKTIWR